MAEYRRTGSFSCARSCSPAEEAPEPDFFGAAPVSCDESTGHVGWLRASYCAFADSSLRWGIFGEKKSRYPFQNVCASGIDSSVERQDACYLVGIRQWCRTRELAGRGELQASCSVVL